MTEIILMRHGETVGNKSGILNAPFDRLTADGVDQVQESGRRLNAEHHASPITAIVSSAMYRAEESARAVGGVLGVAPVTVPGLHERYLGMLEGLLVSDARAVVDDQDLIRGLDDIYYVDGTYGSESLEETARRVGLALKNTRRKNQVEKVLVVTHGDAAVCGAAHMTGVDPRILVRALRFKNAEYATIYPDGRLYKDGKLVVADGKIVV
ncbi:histidine phosphatase family protein [Candidatus Saccharibacteria bacterium]|nr:histidine phosphatase family protein [Candidatus Saccharibacteria bacterium]